MSKRGKIIIAFLLLSLVSIIAFMYYQIKKLINAKWTYSGFKLKSINLQKAIIILYMKVENSGLISVTINNQKYDAYLNNNFVSKIYNEKPFIISKGVSYMPLEVEIKLSDAIKAGAKNILDLLTDKSKINISIKGNYDINIGAFSVRDIPFEYSFKLEN